MRLFLGDLEIECTPAEFLELFLDISRSHHRRIDTQRKGSSTRTGRKYQSIIETMSREPNKVWNIQELSIQTKLNRKSIWKYLTRGVREGILRKVSKGEYSFGEGERQRSPDNSGSSADAALSGKTFDEMFQEVRHLLSANEPCSELAIKKHFRKLPSSVVESFLAEALRRGLMKEELGVYVLR